MRFVTSPRVLILAFALGLTAQQVLDNDAIIKLVKSGIGEDLVVSMIATQPGNYKTAADDVVALKQAGVSDRILSAMVSHGNAAEPAAGGESVAPAAPPVTAPPTVSEVGIYYRKDGEWKGLAPEKVTWKARSVLKAIGTAGLAKGEASGQVSGAHSPNQFKTPVDILVYAPESAAIADYQLLYLREDADVREFRTAGSGTKHSSGGARDVIPFESNKIAARMWAIVLPNLGPGDYGFLPPSVANSKNVASIEKIYSFRIIE